MVQESILVRLLGLSSHLLLSRYLTILTYKFYARVEKSRFVGNPTSTRDLLNNLYLNASHNSQFEQL